MERAPLLLPALAFIGGIVLDANGLTALAFGAAAVCAFVRRDVAIGLCCGVLAGMLHGHPVVVTHDGRTGIFAGVVTGDVRDEDGLVSFPFAVDGFATLRAQAHERVRPGERLVVRGRIAAFDEPRNPGEPSQRAIALADGIAGELSIGRVMSRAPPDLRDPRVWMPLLRARASAFVRRSLPEPHATVLAGALWGERGMLPHDLRDDFQATGTVHVLVTAGLHLGVIAALVGAALALLRLPRAVAALATIPPIFLYAWFSGWHLPSQRAAIMLTVALVARACGARAVSLNTLAIAAIAVAAMWPVAVTGVSFALSFSCVAAIVLFAEPIGERLRQCGLPRRVTEALALTISTQIGVWPLTAATFFTIAPYAIVANALVVPLVGMTLVCGLGALAVQGVPVVATVFIRWDGWLLSIIIAVVHVIAALPGARFAIAPPPMWSVALYDLIAMGAAIVLRRSMRGAVALLVCGTVLVGVAALPRAPGVLTITVLDVGQADAIVIRTPRGHTIVIDTGGRLERGPSVDGRSPAERAADRIVLPYLQRAGIGTIDLLVLTHPHGDHVGGFAGLVRGFDVRKVYDSGQVYGGRAFNDGMREAATRHILVHVARCGDGWSSGDGVSIDVLSPCGALLADGKNDVNENSVVVRLRYLSFRMLFTGDAGFETERRLLEGGVDLRADVLKIGHHGSAYATSREFLAAVQPRIAMISVGRHNLFGHPARSALSAISAAHAAIFRTDRCGAVTVSIESPIRVVSMLRCLYEPSIGP